ncbi:MAG: pilus assembly protein TadG-related protein [Candidatus Wallbacteria bacterium]|nr:pilus assembly protein TadG-related protein [Candidatus Wallbacteria bacterium]
MKIKFYLLNKKGVSIVIVALSVVVLMGMAALAIDVGNAYMQKSTLDQAAQLAALSAAQAMKNSSDPAVIQQKALDVFAQNGLPTDQADITVNVTKGTETAFIDAHLNVPFYFARVLGFNDVSLNSQALAELCADGSAKLIKENTYDLVPWGIPHGRTTYNATEQKLYIDGTVADNWTENSSFQFYQGYEYLLKLGLGQPADAIGRKILIPMDSTGDCNPADANDPICPEVGSHVQADLIKAYGLVYWCLQNNYAVDWLLDYNGGSYLVDYNDAILSATSATSPTVNFSSVSKITLSAAQAATLSNWLAANNSSEGRPYQIVHVTNYPQVAVYTANVYSPADLVPWGLEDQAAAYPFGYVVGNQYTLKYGPDQSPANYGPGNFGALTMVGNGANDYRNGIASGVPNPNGETWYVGKTVYTKTGNMAGPTIQGLSDRLAAGKIYCKVPVVDSMDMNGHSSTTIKGFLNFKINSVDSNGNFVYGTLVDKVPTDQLSYTVNEDSNTEVVAKVLKQAGIPFSWIHDAGVIDGTINNYDWLYTHHEDFQNNLVPAKIAQWVSAGHYYFDMCWSTDRFDNALEDYNHDTFGTTTSQYIPRMFFNSYSSKQYSACYRCSSSSGKDCDACRYSGWVWEWVKHTDVNTDNNPTYSLSPRDIMQTQNHVTTIPADGSLGRTNAFKLTSLISAQNIYAKDNSAAEYKLGIYEYFNYSGTNYAKAMIRDYKINSTDLGGVVCFMGGHDPSNTPAYRLILNNVMASSIAPAVARTSRTNYGALDMDSSDDGLTADSGEYLANIEYGYKYFLAPGAILETLPYNLPEQTNTGVAFNVGSDASTWNSHATDSQRIVLVPIVSIRNSDNSLTCISPDNTSQAPKSVYGIYQRDKVRLKGIAKFWLLDVTKPGSYDSTLGPIENGQVRGIFLGYYITPADAK